MRQQPLEEAAMYCDKALMPVCSPAGATKIPLSGSRRRFEPILLHLKKLVRPEPTDLPLPPTEPAEDRMLGVVKALFWLAVSIGLGTVMAAVCN